MTFGAVYEWNKGGVRELIMWVCGLSGGGSWDGIVLWSNVSERRAVTGLLGLSDSHWTHLA